MVWYIYLYIGESNLLLHCDKGHTYFLKNIPMENVIAKSIFSIVLILLMHVIKDA